MDKKILGIRVGTYLTALSCLIFAVAFWVFVKVR